MKQLLLIGVGFLTLCSILSMAGCGSTEESQESLPQVPAEAPGKTPPAMKFETKTDTVNAIHGVDHSMPGKALRSRQIRFMVQIGAFKDPQNASRVQVTARGRYHMPVVNDYHTKFGLYQIRIGFFESREAAIAFRQKLLKEFPAEYKDTWVVQLKR